MFVPPAGNDRDNVMVLVPIIVPANWLGAAFVVLLPHLIQQAFLLGGASSSAQIQIIAPIQLVLFGVITIGFLLFEPAGLNGIWSRVRRYFQMWPLKHSSGK